jgi:hypothetical protein
MVRTPLAIRSPNHRQIAAPSIAVVAAAFRGGRYGVRQPPCRRQAAAFLRSGRASARFRFLSAGSCFRSRSLIHRPHTASHPSPALTSPLPAKLALKSGNESCDQANSENHRSDHSCIAFAICFGWLSPRSHCSSPLPPPVGLAANGPSRPGFNARQEDFFVRANDGILLAGWKIRPAHPTHYRLTALF